MSFCHSFEILEISDSALDDLLVSLVQDKTLWMWRMWTEYKKSWRTKVNLYCHNPTNNPKQLKTTFVGVVLLSVKNPPPHHDHTTTTPGIITFKVLWGKLSCLILINWINQPYSNPTRWNMEDDLNIFENGRRPQFFWKMDFDIIFFEIRRQPQFFLM